MEHGEFHARTRKKGVNPITFGIARPLIQAFGMVFFRLSRKGKKNIPKQGPVIIAANHRSFIDPFMVGVCTWRPVYYVAKRELFRKRFYAWLLNSWGAFPVNRGTGDSEMVKTAQEILDRGDVLLIFPEGTRIHKPTLARAKRGIGRLALETGATVIPVAVRGTENVRKGRWVRPAKVRVLVGEPLSFPKVDRVSPQLAGEATDQIWPHVVEQWRALGGPVDESVIKNQELKLLTRDDDPGTPGQRFLLAEKQAESVEETPERVRG